MINFEKFKAFLFREFWTGCPRCHGEFGGHQPYKVTTSFREKTGEWSHFRLICHRCANEYNKLSEDDRNFNTQGVKGNNTVGLSGPSAG